MWNFCPLGQKQNFERSASDAVHNIFYLLSIIFYLAIELRSMAMRTRQRQLCLSDLLRGLLHVLVLAATLQCRDAGAAKLKNVVILKHCEEGINLVRLAGQLKDHAVGRQVDDLGLVNAGNLPQGGAVPGIARYL